VVIGTRLKRAGMHRTVCGANAIIALRCSKLSGRYEDFWERRSDRAAACLKTQVQLCIVSFIPLLVRTRTAVALFDRADVAPPLGRNRALLCLPGRDPASGIHHQQRESLNMSLRKVIRTRGSKLNRNFLLCSKEEPLAGLPAMAGLGPLRSGHPKAA
jgi:hypothetical protein